MDVVIQITNSSGAHFQLRLQSDHYFRMKKAAFFSRVSVRL